MSTNVIPLLKNAPDSSLATLPRAEEAWAVSIPPEIARSIRVTAGMHSKDPQTFLIDWLKFGFPENAA